MNSEMMARVDVLQEELKVLSTKHRALDGELRDIEEPRPHDQHPLRRLQKETLGLKDRIARLEEQITPDIIA